MARTDTSPSQSKRFLTFVSILLIVAALYLGQEVLMPLALAVLLCFLLAPAVRRLERLRIGRIAAVLTVVIGVSVGIVALGYVVSVQTVNLAENIEQYQDNILDKVRKVRPEGGGLLEKLAAFGNRVKADIVQQPATTQATTQTAEGPAVMEMAREVGQFPPTGRQREDAENARHRRAVPGSREELEGEAATRHSPTTHAAVPVTIVDAQSSPLTQLGAYLGLVLSPLGTAGIVAVFVIFMLIEREDLRDRMVKLVGFGQLNVTTKAIDDAGSRISRYLLAQAIVNGTYGIAITLGLWAIGAIFGDQVFPNAILWGLLCAVLRFIPYVGPWIAAAFPLIVAIAVYPSFAVFAAVIGMFVVIELLSNNFMEPWLYGSSTGMSAVAVLVSAVFWTWLWGPVGLVMATPLTVCIVVLGKHVPNLRFFDILLGDDPVFAPAERIYQRLLAGDAEEAADIANEFLKKMTLEEVYDQVIMPALAMSEHDRHRGMIDEQGGAFILRSARDLIEELGDQHRINIAKGLVEPSRLLTTSSVPSKSGDVTTSTALMAHNRLSIPKDCVVNVVIMPAHDEADEVVGVMLNQLLTSRGYCATLFSVTALAGEMVQQAEQLKIDIAVVSALPPSAVTHSRYLCKRLHLRLPSVPTIVGLWAYKGDMAKATDRIACIANVAVRNTLSDVLTVIDQRAHSVIASGESTKKSGSAASSPPVTTS